jgi:hypothetical protein
MQVGLAIERLDRHAVAGLADQALPARAFEALFDQRAPVRLVGGLAQVQCLGHFRSA